MTMPIETEIAYRIKFRAHNLPHIENGREMELELSAHDSTTALLIFRLTRPTCEVLSVRPCAPMMSRGKS
jgi:hypothetical protein